MSSPYDIAKLATAVIVILITIQYAFRLLGFLAGSWVRSRTKDRRELLISQATVDSRKQNQQNLRPSDKASSSTSLDDDWENIGSNENSQSKSQPREVNGTFNGIVGFFHPFCNAGGGGERVLYAAIQATQQHYPNALCVVYTGDHEVSKEQLIANAHNRFNITLNAAKVSFLYLTTRDFVLASKYPHFTLLGQSLGSLILGWDAFNLLVPDILVDTMGYAFVLALGKWLFSSMPIGAYVHYPTISTDMLSSLHGAVGSQGLNAGLGKGARGRVKQWYWELFAKLYSWAGGYIDVVMTNSTWTQRHITTLWSEARAEQNRTSPISIVYPPCAVSELHSKVTVDSKSEEKRTRSLLYIAQFRPEKVHSTIISAFTEYLKALDPGIPKPKLILAGSVRDDQDEKHVYKLRLQAQEVKDHVEFVINAKWQQLLDLLTTSSIGVNGMWNEHFGIGVVEYQAAGLISVVNDSGGPKEDIVVDFEGAPTGFHASTIDEYAEAFDKVLNLSPDATLAMRLRARKNSLRFSEEVFKDAWATQVDRLVKMIGSQK